jgi:hypothetical protein
MLENTSDIRPKAQVVWLPLQPTNLALKND